MKKNLSVLLPAMLFSLAVIAEQQRYQGYGNNNHQNGSDAYNSSCIAKIEEDKLRRKDNGTTPGHSTDIHNCEELKLIAAVNGQEMDGPAEQKTTMDGKYHCIKHGGYTLDFDDCERVKKAYDAVALAEQGMFAAQTIRVNELNHKQTKAIEAATRAGDGQNAAIDATIERNNQNAKINKNQVKLYGAAVAALSSQMVTWQGNEQVFIKKACSKGADRFQEVAEQQGIAGQIDCVTLLKKEKENARIFANKDTRLEFVMALAEYIQKADAANKRAGMNETVAERLKKSKVTEDEVVNELDVCVINPMASECVSNNGQTITPGTFSGNQVQFSNAGNGQTFDFSEGGHANLEDNNSIAPGNAPEKISDIAAPFEDAAKEASGILNPVAAASVTPGQQTSSPGGGGGGGGGGAGSVSLGDDLDGANPDENKDPDINTTKVSGKYKSGGGKGSGFQAVKSAKEDANPFASLFDAEGGGAGGIEEDRSIASEDIDDRNLGLFQKISKKYGQMQEDKRLDQIE